jgi:hypothetical protein
MSTRIKLKDMVLEKIEYTLKKNLMKVEIILDLNSIKVTPLRHYTRLGCFN